MLEELQLPYEAHLVRIGENDQKTHEFLSLNPNGKIRAIIDPHGPGDKRLQLQEFPRVVAWIGRAMARPASARGVNIPPQE